MLPSSGAERWRSRVVKSRIAELLSQDSPPVISARYQLGDQIGQGASARVYRALDRDLGRVVALKLLNGPAPDRFLREARTLARISHPNVIHVYDIGCDDGQAYLVMELVEGPSFAELLARGSPDCVRILERVARGVHYAHTQGIIHRDLKPANVMIDAAGEAKVVDFGLARVTGASRLTRSGAVLGTPGYMAPEQLGAAPGQVDARTDVYALGAMLYEILSGAPPFRGESLPEIYHRILNQDPPPVARHVPRDLRLVCLKALQKDPRNRYSTAEEFADDLARYARGEPVLARATSRTSLVYRRIVRHPLLMGVGAILVVVAAAAVFYYVRGNRERAAALLMMRQTARVSVEAALAVRRSGAGAQEMRRFLPPLQAAYEASRQRAPNVAEIPYLLGRMYRALLDPDQALLCQDRALQLEPDFAPALYERIVLRNLQYEAEWIRARALLAGMNSESPPVIRFSGRKSPAREDIERVRPGIVRLREGILDDCRAFRRLLLAGGIPEDRVSVDLVDAFFESVSGHPHEARVLMERAASREPFCEEAWHASAHLLELAAEAGEEPDLNLSRAEERYVEGMARDRGYVPFLIGLGWVRFKEGCRVAARGDSPLPRFAQAEEDYGEAMRLHSSPLGGLDGRSVLRSHRADWKARHGVDANLDYAAALEDLARVLEMAPRKVEALALRGALRASRRKYLGEQASEDLSAALKDLSESIRLDPLYGEAWANRGCLHALEAQDRQRAGQDPLSQYQEAEKDLSQALKCNPDYVFAWTMRGSIRCQEALHRAGGGEDPQALYSSALSDFSQAIEREPADPEPWMRRGSTLNNVAALQTARGADASQTWAKGERDLDEALRLNPRLADARLHRGEIRNNRAYRRIQAGLDAGADLDGAEQDFSAFLEARSGEADGWLRRANVRNLRGFVHGRANKPAARDFRAAVSDYEEALRLRPSLMDQIATPLAAAREGAQSGR
jgi:tetratricopeptide (TPR) repeat protein